MKDFDDKCNKLTKIIDNCTKNDIVVAFSGGVDSSLLLKIACNCAKFNNKKIYAVTVFTIMNTAKEYDFTRNSAEKIGAIYKNIDVDILNEAGIINNPTDRCYLCKKYMFSKIYDFAKSVKVDCIIDGTNFDDLQAYRPGIKALKEFNVLSPLAQVGMTKEEVRRLATDYNIPACDIPSTPCLATRFEYGATLNYEKIKKVEQAEDYIKSLGFYNVRLRVHGDLTRIEVDFDDISKIVKLRVDIINFLKKLGYKYITLDLEGFNSGSMDRHIGI